MPGDAMMLEKTIEKLVGDYAKVKGWLSYKWVSPGHIGVPDRIFVSPVGKVVFVEFKRLGKPPTQMQAREHARMRQQGCSVHVIASVDLGKAMIDACADSL